MFSNTVRAHELGTTHDWVVIYRDDDGNHGQWTVITSHFGKLRGKRIVRGREAECASHYAGEATAHQGEHNKTGSQIMLWSSGVN
jgi:putative hydrolase